MNHKLKEFAKPFGCEGDSFYRFGRVVYKYTSCGPWMKAILKSGEEVYYESDRANDIGPETELVSIVVGSIVEGWDGDGIGPIEVSDPKNLASVIDEIDKAAGEIWDIVNREEQDECDGELIGEIAAGMYRPGGY